VASSSFVKGYKWQVGDSLTTSWTPQGITGNGTILASSWYHKPGSGEINKGVRIAFVDTNAMAYRFALLAQPYLKASVASFEPITIHAGGIAWVGNYLYVADTHNGLRLFNMRRFLKPTKFESDKSLIGLQNNGKYYTAGYLFILPQANHYVLSKDSSPLIFSFVSSGLSETGRQVLLTGEYSKVAGGRVMRWPIGQANNRTDDIGVMATVSKPQSSANTARKNGLYMAQLDRAHAALVDNGPLALPPLINGKWLADWSGVPGVLNMQGGAIWGDQVSDFVPA